MKTLKVALGTGILMAGLLSSALAKTPTAPKMGGAKMGSHKMAGHKMMGGHMSQMTGTVLGMTSHTLTVAPVQHNKMGKKMTITIPASAKIMQSGHAIKMSSLRPGEKVTVMMKGSAVTGVNVMGSHAKAGSKMASHKMGAKMGGSKMMSHKSTTKM